MSHSWDGLARADHILSADELQVGDQLGSQLFDVLIYCRFDLGPGRVRMLFAPLSDAQTSSALACCIYALRSRLFFLAFMLTSLSLAFSPSLPPPAFVQKNETQPCGCGIIR